MHRYRTAPKQEVICYECGSTWPYVPAGFIYDDPGAGWHQDAEAPLVSGYCRPCADGIEASRSVYGGRGHELIERRTIEDEIFVWDR